ncbi:MutS family DNA mismatch repair protein [Ferruginibacter sp.]|uniref:MutS family DNA mismatch repair protein n=1 Tax=Ferruginibacter sp. TaxID=1940288 RepID=UPI002658175E|nr:MutS family DNA mismatch repair protein [Ferruginibacter sp.]
MLPEKYYRDRITTLQQQLQQQLQKKSWLGWSRFAVVLILGLAIYLLLPSGLAYVGAATVLLAIIFTRLLFTDLRNKSAIENTRHLVQINEDEIKSLAHNYYSFDDGQGYMPKEHPYANDLDIFGRASLFQYTDRTTSDMGSATLAQWLLEPADVVTIVQRQEAVKELTTVTDWRQQLEAFGRQQKITAGTQQRLREWLQATPHFIGNYFWKIIQYAVPAVMIGILILNIEDVVSNHVRNLFLLGSAIIAYAMAKKIAPLHEQVSKMADELSVLANSVQLIEQTTFKSPLLNTLQQYFIIENTKASVQLKQLKKIVERLDIRLNPVVFVPLAIIFQWDVQQAMALEKWKQRNRQNIGEWFDAIGALEALHSFAGLIFNHPDWCFPDFKTEHFFIEGESIGHPLISAAKRVNNNISITHKGELMLITGSNMAGKSTYLRSIGINTVLAMAGAPVCAASFTLSPVQIISSMRIADNLEESTSTFYAELKKLKAIIDRVNAGEKIFILLDEILRGTNSLDRHTGSVALVKQLIRHQAACIIATHDVELARLKETYPENILNYHFDAQVSNDELYFDYQLKTGVCESLNASILMKKIGIEL